MDGQQFTEFLAFVNGERASQTLIELCFQVGGWYRPFVPEDFSATLDPPVDAEAAAFGSVQTLKHGKLHPTRYAAHHPGPAALYCICCCCC